VAPSAFNLAHRDRRFARLRRFGGRDPLGPGESLALLAISLAGLAILCLLQPDRSLPAPAPAAFSRHSAARPNTLFRPPEGAAAWIMGDRDAAATFDSPALRRSGPIHAGSDNPAWPISGLSDATLYFWRVKSSDGLSESPWSVTGFCVNLSNDAPRAPAIRSPGRAAPGWAP
jgi:hypothetical protein